MSNEPYNHEVHGDFVGPPANVYLMTSKQKLEAIRIQIEQHVDKEVRPLMSDPDNMDRIMHVLSTYGPMYGKTVRRLRELNEDA